VYDVALVPTAMVRGLRRGFDTNAERISGQAARRAWQPLESDRTSCAAMGRPLAGIGSRVTLRVDGAAPERAGERTTVGVTVHNLGPPALATVPPHPVSLSYRWRRDGAQIDGERVSLGGLLDPGEETTLVMPLVAPEAPGNYRLDISLVQDGVFWFVDEDARNGVSFTVDVAAPSWSVEVARQA
jgi:hypothetical protein